MATQDILFETVPGRYGDLGIITLNRPQALNALTLAMIAALRFHLDSWQESKQIKAVVIHSNHPKAFCVGGDIRKLYDAGKSQDPELLNFFSQEYQINLIINNYSKPYISLLNGMTMGGGVGISLHGSHPIAGENFSFAMPETSIGFFPDIGGSFLLNNCRGDIGTYLGLTGAKIKREDAVTSQLIKYCVDSQYQAALLNALCDTEFGDNPRQTVNDLIMEFHKAPLPGSLAEHENEINNIFSLSRLDLIFKKLADANSTWCHEVLTELKQKSPSSLKLTLALLRHTRKRSLEQCLLTDYRIVSRILQYPDFYEGVRALLIEKDNKPQWAPALSDPEIESFFAPLPQELN